MATKKGDTLFFEQLPSITAYSAVAGKMEGDGPLGSYIDVIDEDTTFGELTWEKSECAMQGVCVDTTLVKAKYEITDIDYVFAGDLLNQCAASGYTLRTFDVPFIGLYGACSTMAESLALASCFVEGGLAARALALTSSHFCSAERQFRFPLEYGGKRTPTAQWTVTGAGSCIVEKQGEGPYIKAVTFGRVRDLGITDANNMGAAMAPAAAQTIKNFFQDSGLSPDSFDGIYTGDLARVGSELLLQLLEHEGIKLTNHFDCGNMIFDAEKQDVKAGASGCGCSATVLCSYLLPQLKSGKMKNILFCATGALMSPTTSMQGESIPGVAHLIHISSEK